MTAPFQLLSSLSTGNTLPAPYPFALATLKARSIRNSILMVQGLGFPRFAGSGRIAGTVKVITTPAPARVVRLYDKASGVLARTTISDGSGLYAFEGLDRLRTYFVTAFDTPGGYNATIEDFVVPA